MRQLGTVPEQENARRFADYLLTKGISLSIDPAPGGWAIWVRNEDHLDEARREFVEFSANPDAPVYRDAARAAEQLRAEEQRRATEAKKNFVNMGQRWRRRGASGAPVTAILIAASIGVAVLTHLGSDKGMVWDLTFDRYLQNMQGDVFPAMLWQKEPWRILTPIFLHFGWMHIVFNMLMMWQLGIPVERVIGSFRYALLVLLIAITSNCGEYLWDVHLVTVEGANGVRVFGGMSGVLYGLFGYVWMKSRYEPQAGFMISRDVVFWMVGWFFVCLSGLFADYIGNVANVVHGVGLIVGMIVGRLPSWWRSMR